MLRNLKKVIASVLAVSISAAIFAFVGCAKDLDITLKPLVNNGENVNNGNTENGGGGADHTHAYTRLVVQTQPDKTSYEEGTTFNGEGMVLCLVCSCNDAQPVQSYQIVYSSGNAFAYGDTSVIVRVGSYEVPIPVTVGRYGEGSWSNPVPLP